jgi:soluble lytic murein transglycosylase-like protein
MQGLLAAITLLLTLDLAPLQATLLSAPSSQPSVRVFSIYEVYQLTQEDEHDPLIVTAAEEWRLDPFLLKGLLYEESRLDPSIINKTSGAAGIAQFTRTGRQGLNRIRRQRGCDDELTYQKSLNPEHAIPASAELLSYLIGRWGRDYGIASYNGGRYKHGFARRVLRQANRYRTLSGLPPLPTRPKRVPLTVS